MLLLSPTGETGISQRNMYGLSCIPLLFYVTRVKHVIFGRILFILYILRQKSFYVLFYGKDRLFYMYLQIKAQLNWNFTGGVLLKIGRVFNTFPM